MIIFILLTLFNLKKMNTIKKLSIKLRVKKIFKRKKSYCFKIIFLDYSTIYSKNQSELKIFFPIYFKGYFFSF
jgi:uncharacterized membrane protein YobD (UPF0266 family)